MFFFSLNFLSTLFPWMYMFFQLWVNWRRKNFVHRSLQWRMFFLIFYPTFFLPFQVEWYINWNKLFLELNLWAFEFENILTPSQIPELVFYSPSLYTVCILTQSVIMISNESNVPLPLLIALHITLKTTWAMPDGSIQINISQYTRK